MSTAKRHIVGFDYLRGLACLGVMLFHYTSQYENSIGHLGNWPISFPTLGRYGVIVFFMISGYLALMHTKDNDTILTYGYKRAIRLYPAYWVAIIVTTLVMAIFLPDRCRSLPEILINFTMLQAFLGVRAVDGVYWTLQLELIFYFFIGLTILFKCKKHILKLSYFWIVALYILHLFPLDNIIFKGLNVFLMNGNGYIFIAGIAIYHLFLRKSKGNVVQCVVLLMLCIVYSFVCKSLHESVYFAILIALVILMTRFEIPTVKILEPIRFISKISYPLYLVHQYIGFAIIYHMERAGLVNEVFVLIPISISMALAFFINRYVEIPVGKFLKKSIK